MTLSTSFAFHPPSSPKLSTLSLHDALPILPTCGFLSTEVVMFWLNGGFVSQGGGFGGVMSCPRNSSHGARSNIQSCLLPDRKSTRLNSSHVSISYAVFCLKKKTLRSSA